jgi:hypothetical protein
MENLSNAPLSGDVEVSSSRQRTVTRISSDTVQSSGKRREFSVK